jgi:hypothetical protein
VGWWSRRPEKSDAELTLEALEHQPASVQPETDDAGGVEELQTGVFLTLTATPASRTPGSPLSVLNEGDPVHAGDRVQLVTFGRTQETAIAALSRGGLPLQTLERDEEGQVVLGNDVDLGDVYRTAALQDPESDEDLPEGWFLLQVQAVEQHGTDVVVVGPALGEIGKGQRVTLEPTLGDDDVRTARVLDVRPQPDGAVCLVLGDADARLIEYGDEVSFANM